MRFILAALLCLLTGAAAAQEHPVFNTKVHPPHATALLDMLKAGGLILYFRHGATPDYMEPGITDFADCAPQRMLNALGRAQAARIGEAMRGLALRIDKVVSSPYCRCVDTATIAFGRATASEDVRDGGDKAALRRRLATKPRDGFNDVILGHGGASGMFGEEFLREAEAMILRPDGAGGYTLIARMRVDSWHQLMPSNRVPPPDKPRAP